MPKANNVVMIPGVILRLNAQALIVVMGKPVHVAGLILVVPSGELVILFNHLGIVLKIVRCIAKGEIVGTTALLVTVVIAVTGTPVRADIRLMDADGDIEKIPEAAIQEAVTRKANVCTIARVFGRYSCGAKKW